MILKYAHTLELGDEIELGGQTTRVDYIQDPESRKVNKNNEVFMEIVLVNEIGQSINMSVPIKMAFLVEEN